MPKSFRQRSRAVTVVQRSPHPVSVFMASSLGSLYGRGINGRAGTVLYGYPGDDTNQASYQGYVSPPQMFVGWNPKRVAGGAVRAAGGQLPATSPGNPADNPLGNAVATIAGIDG